MKQFNMIDEKFICENCGKEINPLGYTARDHCPSGDRANSCKGLLKPIGIEKFKDTYKILYKCTNCHQEHKNIVAKDDDMNEIIKISKV